MMTTMPAFTIQTVPQPLLKVQDLRVEFSSRRGNAMVLNGVEFEIRANETLCLVGESGCGKSMTALALLRLIPSPPGRISGGQILFQGADLANASEAHMCDVRDYMRTIDKLKALNSFGGLPPAPTHSKPTLTVAK